MIEKTALAKALTVGEWLSQVDYSPQLDYIPSDFALEMVALIKLIDGDETENKTPVVHFRMFDSYVSDSKKDIINLCFRGFAKSTIMEYLIFRIAIYGDLPGLGAVPYGLYVSDSIDNGVKKMRLALERRWEKSEFLKKMLPKAKFTDIRWEFFREDGTSTVFTGHGAKTGVRGTRENGSRPVICLLDDIISDEDARSPTMIASINETVHSALEHALHPKRRKIVWNGTPFNANDPIYTAVESGAWEVNVFPVCEKFPCSKEEFVGAWTDRFDYDSVSAGYEKARMQGKEDSFYREMMLQILSDDTRLIKKEEIQWFSRKDLLQYKSNFNFYVTTDFATSEKQFSDFSFISVWAVNNKGFKYWVDGICKRQTMDKNINDLFRLCQQYMPQSVGIEVSGQQGGFIPWIQQEQMRRNVYFNMASEGNGGNAGIRPTTNKLQRFNIAVPWFKAKEMFFPVELKEREDLREMILELSQTTIGGFKSKHDDALDTVSMLALMPIWLPGEPDRFSPDDSGIWSDEDFADDSYAIDNYLV